MIQGDHGRDECPLTAMTSCWQMDHEPGAVPSRALGELETARAPLIGTFTVAASSAISKMLFQPQ